MVDGKVLARKEAQVCVYPDRLERRWPVTTETLSMVDNRELLSIIVDEVKGDSIGIVLNETLLKDAVHRKDALCYTPQESEKKRLKLVPLHPVMVSFVAIACRCRHRQEVSSLLMEQRNTAIHSSPATARKEIGGRPDVRHEWTA